MSNVLYTIPFALSYYNDTPPALGYATDETIPIAVLLNVSLIYPNLGRLIQLCCKLTEVSLLESSNGENKTNC
jgi:hypothetical protein